MDLTNSSLRTSYSYSQFSPSRVCLNYRHFLINLSKTPAILSLIYQGRIASILRLLTNHTYSRLLFSATDLLSQSFLAKARLFLTNHPYSRLLFSATDCCFQLPFPILSAHELANKTEKKVPKPPPARKSNNSQTLGSPIKVKFNLMHVARVLVNFCLPFQGFHRDPGLECDDPHSNQISLVPHQAMLALLLHQSEFHLAPPPAFARENEHAMQNN